MARHRKAKQLRKSPRKTPIQKETAQEPTVDHTADHQNIGNDRELRDDASEHQNCHTRKLTDPYKLYGIAPIKR